VLTDESKVSKVSSMLQQPDAIYSQTTIPVALLCGNDKTLCTKYCAQRPLTIQWQMLFQQALLWYV